MRVAILGSGPAGLFAAHAAVGLGSDVRIFSAGQKSRISGAQWLRRPIPGLSGDPFLIHYKLDGLLEVYNEKVENDSADVIASLESLLDGVPAWDLREAYDRAWQEYGPLVEHAVIHHGQAPSRIVDWADLIVSSIPLDQICTSDHHTFFFKKIWVTDFVKKMDTFESDEVDNTIVCSGHEDDWWYRQARICGYESTEYPEGRHPNSKGIREIEIPMSSDCDCHPNILRVGQSGTWRRNKYADSGFYDTEAHIRLTIAKESL